MPMIEEIWMDVDLKDKSMHLSLDSMQVSTCIYTLGDTRILIHL